MNTSKLVKRPPPALFTWLSFDLPDCPSHVLPPQLLTLCPTPLIAHHILPPTWLPSSRSTHLP